MMNDESKKRHVFISESVSFINSFFFIQYSTFDVGRSNSPVLLVILAPELTRISEAVSVGLKLECLQNTGAFKVRGAASKILGLSQAEQDRSVITFSTGNHGKATAFVADKRMTAVITGSSIDSAQYLRILRNKINSHSS